MLTVKQSVVLIIKLNLEKIGWVSLRVQHVVLLLLLFLAQGKRFSFLLFFGLLDLKTLRWFTLISDVFFFIYCKLNGITF